MYIMYDEMFYTDEKGELHEGDCINKSPSFLIIIKKS